MRLHRTWIFRPASAIMDRPPDLARPRGEEEGTRSGARGEPMKRAYIQFVLVFALIAAACDGGGGDAAGQVGSEAGSSPLKVTMTSWTGYGLFHLAARQGFFERNGVDVEITVVEDEAATPSALEANRFQGQLTT